MFTRFDFPRYQYYIFTQISCVVITIKQQQPACTLQSGPISFLRKTRISITQSLFHLALKQSTEEKTNCIY